MALIFLKRCYRIEQKDVCTNRRFFVFGTRPELQDGQVGWDRITLSQYTANHELKCFINEVYQYLKRHKQI